MVLVCAPAHRLAKSARISLGQLNGERIVGFDSELTIRREIDRALGLHGATVNVVMEFDNIETIKRAIEIDAGVSLLPEPTVAHEVALGTLAAVPLDTDELVRPLGIIHRRGKELNATAKRFIELLEHEARRLFEHKASSERRPDDSNGSDVNGRNGDTPSPAASDAHHGREANPNGKATVVAGERLDPALVTGNGRR